MSFVRLVCRYTLASDAAIGAQLAYPWLFGSLRGLVIRLDCDEPSPSAPGSISWLPHAFGLPALQVCAAPCTMPRLVLLLAVAAKAAALSQKNWLKLPDVDLNPGTFTRRTVASGAAVSAVATPIAASAAQKTASRRAGDIQQWPRIPVWPSWAGGRVIPMGLPNADPFLLVAHHKHWFDPRDPLRGPFRAFGKATGLPYIAVWK